MFRKIFYHHILKNFLTLDLTSGERKTTEESIEKKYLPALKRTCIYCVLSILPLVFLDTSIVISVLIPITMVAGTARFSISLSNMKQKFEAFGLELTTNLFEAFTVSLGLLLFLTIFSLGDFVRAPLIQQIEQPGVWKYLSLVIGIIMVAHIIYKIFAGSIKYDINDAMLTGQNEAAERFYRRSLSLLHSVGNSLKNKKSLQVANYYIGVAFFEIFQVIKELQPDNKEITSHIQHANLLIKEPSLGQKKADKIALGLIEEFMKTSVNPLGHASHKSMEAIRDEQACLIQNVHEEQEMVDTRFAVIFEEIANLIEGQGETLFIQNQ